MQHIAIAGATGFIGQALTTHCLTQGYTITVITRSQDKAKALFGDKVSILSWDSPIDTVKQQLQDCQALINLAGENIAAKRWNPAFQQRLIDSRTQMAATLKSWYEQLEHQPRLLIASALSAYGCYTKNETVFKEHDQPQETDSFLYQMSTQIEQAYHDWPAAHTVSFLRFALVLDRRGGILKKMLLPSGYGLGAVFGNGKQAWSWVALEDVLCAIEHILQHNELHGPINIVSPERLNQKDAANAMAFSMSRPRWLFIPGLILKLILGNAMANALLLQGTLASNKHLCDSGYRFKNMSVDNFLKKTKGG